MILLWQRGFQNTKLQREFVTVNQAKSSFCWESPNGERKEGPGILSQILDTCFCSSLTDNKQWHSTYTPANTSYDQRLDAPFCSSHQARGLHKTHDSPVGRVTLASEQERGAKGVVLCPPLDKGREADVARSQGWGPKGGQFFLWPISNGRHVAPPPHMPVAASQSSSRRMKDAKESGEWGVGDEWIQNPTVTRTKRCSWRDRAEMT